MKTIFTFLLCGLLITKAYSQPGSLDNTFGTNGKVITPIGTSTDIARAIAVQSDGKIIAAGQSQNGTNPGTFALARYNINGTLDNTFDGDGKVTTAIASNGIAFAVAIQSDGKIVVAGFASNGANNDFALARYNTNGSLDNTFDGDGKLTTDFGSGNDQPNALAIQSDGKIVVAGLASNGTNDDFALARYNTNGTLDNTFDGDGKLTTDFSSGIDRGFGVTIQSDGKIVVAGFVRIGTNNDDFALARYNTDGTLDNTFDGDGKLTTAIGSTNDQAYAIALQSDGKIVAAGAAQLGSSFDERNFALARYNVDGTLDNTFDGDGKVTLDFGRGESIGGMALFGNRIYLAGGTNVNGKFDFAIAAFQNDATALPLSITSLTASKQNTSVQLNWKTVDVQNTSAFEIERSTDARNFTKVGAVNAVNST